MDGTSKSLQHIHCILNISARDIEVQLYFFLISESIKYQGTKIRTCMGLYNVIFVYVTKFYGMINASIGFHFLVS